jgi:hypothetical protein
MAAFVAVVARPERTHWIGTYALSGLLDGQIFKPAAALVTGTTRRIALRVFDSGTTRTTAAKPVLIFSTFATRGSRRLSLMTHISSVSRRALFSAARNSGGAWFPLCQPKFASKLFEQ